LFEQFSTCFNDADHVIVTPVYAAGEQPIPGITHETLVKALVDHGHRSVRAIDGLNGLTAAVREAVRAGDEMVVCLGAGDITGYANGLADEMKKA
jgi:UDP-N-acetylmuramate--alanine ligase